MSRVNAGVAVVAFEDREGLSHGSKERCSFKEWVSKQLASCSDRIGWNLGASSARSSIGQVVLGL